MTTKFDLDKERIRAARWEPGEGFREGIDRALKNLPPRKGSSYGKLALAAAAVAAALLLTLATPPVLRAVLGGARDTSVAAATARPAATDELTLQMADLLYAARRSHAVDAGVDFRGMRVTVASVRRAPDRRYTPHTQG